MAAWRNQDKSLIKLAHFLEMRNGKELAHIDSWLKEHGVIITAHFMARMSTTNLVCMCMLLHAYEKMHPVFVPKLRGNELVNELMLVLDMEIVDMTRIQTTMLTDAGVRKFFVDSASFFGTKIIDFDARPF